MRAFPERGNPQEPSILAEAEVQGGFDETAKLPARIERYGRARSLARETLDYLESVTSSIGSQYNRIELEFLAAKALALSECGEYLHFRHYYTADKVRLHGANFCKAHLLCPLCAIRRGAKSLAAYLRRFEVIQATKPGLKVSLIT